MNKVRYVLDASAVLALVHGERGAEIVESCLDQGAVICAVNLSEVVAKCAELGLDAAAFRVWFASLGIAVIPADEALSFDAGVLRVRTMSIGLSLGDRFCLALARTMRVPAVTADQAWKKLEPDPQCLCIRD